MARMRRIAVTAIFLLASTGVAVFASQTPALACVADADNDCYRAVTGTVTATAGLNVRAAPWGTVLDTVPYNYSNSVDCYVQASDGSYWDWLYDTRISRSGWVYDPYLYTGGNIYQQVDEMHEGNCGTVPLSMPGNVHASAISSGAIRVTWTDTNAATANYVISNGNVSSPDQPVGAQSYNWSGLAPNTYMCFTVAAKRSGQQSPWTAYACATTWSLTTPVNVTAVATAGSVIHVTWTDTTGGAAQFVVTNGNSTSSNLAAGTTTYNWTGMAPGTYMCFAVAAKQSGLQSAWSPWACTTTPTYVNLGDSFSSGEGTYSPYLSGSDTTTDKCHRSPNSYSGQLATMSTHWAGVTNVACSGAVTNDLINSVSGTNEMSIPANEPAQLSALGPDTGLVTFTIGGNNLDLADVFNNCIQLADLDKTDQCFHNAFSNDFINNIPKTLETAGKYGPSLDTVFSDISNDAPNAKIVVSTYPQILPATFSYTYPELVYPFVDIYVITSADQLSRVRQVVSAINGEIKAEAAKWGFTVCDEENAFAGHEIGTATPWVNDVQGFQYNALGQQTSPPNNESLHPNTAGYQKWAADLTSSRCGGLG